MKILLIDDDAGCLDSLKSSLEISGHKCDAYTKPENALKAYKPGKFDVVITDMKMPNLSGIDVLKKIKARNQDAKVIIITAYGDVETAISAVNNHAYAFFGKPLNFEELMETLEKIEREQEKRQLTKEEMEKLSVEYQKLRLAYDELQALLNRPNQAPDGVKG